MNMLHATKNLEKAPEVTIDMYKEQRERLTKSFDEQSDVPEGGIILLQGGEERCRDDSDCELIFRQESNFKYLFGCRDPGCYGLIDLKTKESHLFIPRLPEVYKIWMGELPTTEGHKEIYGVDHCHFSDEISAVVEKMDPSIIYTLHGLCHDSGAYAKSAEFNGMEQYRIDNGKLFPILIEQRVIKTEKELKLMRQLNKICSGGHIANMQVCKPGMTEIQVESVFRHYCMFVGGSRLTSFTPIAGSGVNSAVLHYGHAGAPNDKVIGDGEMILCDMGSEYNCYASDITCSFPVNGKFTEDQKFVYETVLEMQKAVMKALKPGIYWPDMHALAYRVMVTRMVEFGLLKGDVEEILATDIPGSFQPHGLGHLMGLDTHDVTYPTKDGPKGKSTRLGHKSVRCCRKMEEGMVVTVEPGVYFIGFLLDNVLADPEQAKYVNVEMLERFRKFGGVRLEDDCIITADGIENMTMVPREVADVEKVMAGFNVEGVETFKKTY
eukprot:TRINITY_DN10652_c0_g1_i1.p1 TRINITY_DN10652_c0_g1~~TRINITY_DN10652_c0_g1_i1.p1  ORF type:complete len:495 (-),score=135.14 TRINITY_DN10652_c0_g1_i1:196-1680(-)